MFDRLTNLFDRIRDYDWWQVAVELVVIWIIVFVVVKLVEGTRAAAALKSVFFLVVVLSLVIRILGVQDALARLNFLYSSIVAVAAIALIVIFQPELRRGLTRLGETGFFGRRIAPATETVDAVSRAAAMLSKARFGAIMVIERNTPLKELIEGGTTLDAEVSAMLLQTVFFPGTALHDLAVVIRKDRIVAAGVQLPMADAADTPDPLLGARHRAAIGVSLETDAIVVVVSEETGVISLAERGDLTRNLNEAELQGLLLLKLNKGLVTAMQEEPDSVEMEPPPEGEAEHEEART
ncbi:MAG: diadenylate cyclase CdaA [Phycisphaerales bacterium]|nr:diadenylate cyclase CdaA [Phycisphaerales bacterium]